MNSRPIFKLLLCLAAIVSFQGAVRPASSQILVFPNILSETVNDWQPIFFELECGPPDGPARPGRRDVSCVTDAARDNIELYLSWAAMLYRDRKYWSPDGLGPVIGSYRVPGRKVVRVFADPTSSYVAYVRWLEDCAGKPNILMAIVPAKFESRQEYLFALTMAHELHHAIDNGGPTKYLEPGCSRPKWVTEGIADALGFDFAKHAVPWAFPLYDGWAEREDGLRPYYVPLHFDFTGIKGQTNAEYETSSFWNYLARRYHRNRYKYTQRYLGNQAPTYANGKADVLRWLDQQLQKDTRIKSPLYIVFPSFLTDFAGQWAPGGIVEQLYQSTLMTKVFGGCKIVNLSPADNFKEFDLGLHAVSGKCLSVRISGLGPSDLASVKIGALSHREEIVDSLHLGFAFTNDQTGFNCAQATRKGKLPPGIAGCLLEPVTGIFETPVESWSAARMWNGSSIEKGHGTKADPKNKYMSNPAQHVGAEIENVYILSYVPTEPWEEKLAGKPPVTVRIGIGLDVTSLSVDGSDVSTGASDGTRSSTRKRAAGALGNKPTATDRIHPASTGYVDLGPVENLFGQPVIDQTGAMNDQFVGEVGFGVETFRLAEVEVKPLGGSVPIDDEELEVLREFTVATNRKLPVGTTGTFEAGISGIERDRPGILLVTPKDETATLTVLENSRGAFRARIQGRVCELDMNAARAGNPKECKPFHTISGEISKPFAYLYQVDNELVSHQTEGEKLYNKYMVARSGSGGASASGAGSASTSPGTGSASSSGTNAGGALNCSCACPDQVAPQTAQCQAQCVPQLAACSLPQSTAAAQPLDFQALNLTIQTQLFGQILGSQGLSASDQQMLISDFATMSEQTRTYLINKYLSGSH